MSETVGEISSDADLQALCGSHAGLTAILLWAPWHPPSVHLCKVLEAIANDQKSVKFAKVNTDVCASIATRLGADQVPFVGFLDPKCNKLDTLAGADPPKLVAKVKSLASRPLDTSSAAAPVPEGEDLNAKLKQLISYSPVMLFMKGSKHEPFCKFSKQAVAILNKHDAEYSTFDILQDNEVREGLKEYSNWRTYPQLYIQGELIGGVDIIQEMETDGSLSEALSIANADDPSEMTLEDRLKSIINKAPVTLFMKGNPDGPRCGFSRKIVELLNANSIKFDYFDILSDEEVRQGLKTYSNWPTYPQLYGNGKLIGGLDIVKELADEGSLMDELSSP
mmetsp:Transcript_3434/g.6733  ORF Transcript_3434/g.6733 Transcript_3434/m.6733 type:complete len:336 (-) Transcript_3434:94-1101(-)